MSAIITENFRKNNVKRLLDDIASTSYYVGIGKSNSWRDQNELSEDSTGFNVVPPIGTFGDQREILSNLTTLIKISGNSCSYVIPNIQAKTNHKHKEWNPFDASCFYQTQVSGIEMYPCYVVTLDNVYLCLRSPSANEGPFILPSGSTTSRIPFVNADGSVWVYLYSIAPEFPIKGNQFVTVPDEPSIVNAETEMSVLNTIANATGDLIFGFTVINPGSGYSSTPTVVFVPSDDPGSPITLDVTISGGEITKVEFDSSIANNPAAWPKTPGYVEISGGGEDFVGVVYPMAAPTVGFGAKPTDTLPAWYLGLTVAAEEDIFGDGAFIPYRQVSIVRDPSYEVGTVNPQLSLNCLQYAGFDSGSSPTSGFDATGSIMTQSSTGAKAIIAHYDSTLRRLYFNQSYETGFSAFVDTDPIAIGVDSYSPALIGESEYIKGSGEVIFAENRQKITRISGQTEELTIILQF